MDRTYFDENNEYIPPRNAVRELYRCTPSGMHAAIDKARVEIEKAKPMGEWPAVPYHYGMGRIKAYEVWLATLSEEECKAQIARSRDTYENYHQKLADGIVSKLAEQGIDLSPHIAEYQEERARARRPASKSHQRDNSGPTLGVGRTRGR